VPLEPVSRRSFFALEGGVAGAALLAACGGDDASGSAPTTVTTDPNALTPGVISSDLYASPRPQRLAFIVQAQNAKPASVGAASIAIAPPGATKGEFVDAKLHTEGLPEDRGIYVVHPTLTTAGIYDATVKTQGQTLSFPFQVAAKPGAPAPGTSAPLAPSATVAAPMGVDPICTRDPQCPLHTVSLSTVIGKGKPVAAMFATPAYCQTQYCGPVLDQLLPFRDQYAGKMEFVHVEIYRDSTATKVTSTVEAWNIPSEPWLFGIDGTGKIVGRLDGAMASDEISALLGQLA
jgi:hypothetical protein